LLQGVHSRSHSRSGAQEGGRRVDFFGEELLTFGDQLLLQLIQNDIANSFAKELLG